MSRLPDFKANRIHQVVFVMQVVICNSFEKVIQSQVSIWQCGLSPIFLWIPDQVGNDSSVFSGFQIRSGMTAVFFLWIPACAGMTIKVAERIRRSLVVSKSLEMIDLTMGLFVVYHVNGTVDSLLSLIK